MTQLTRAVSVVLVLAIVAGVASIAHAQGDSDNDSDKKKIVRALDVNTELRASEEFARVQLALARASRQVADLNAQLARLRTKFTRSSDIIIAINGVIAVAKVKRTRAAESLALLLEKEVLAKRMNAERAAEHARFVAALPRSARTEDKMVMDLPVGFMPTKISRIKARRVQLELEQPTEMSVAAMQREILGMMREMRRDVREIRELVESMRRDRARRPRAPGSAR